MAANKKEKDNQSIEKPTIARSAYDLQRIKLEKLMKNPDKPVLIPERPREKSNPHVPDFVRNVMGSSAGAGSGEFHVYRHLRRKEYSRQKFIQEKGEKELLDEAYEEKIEVNKRMLEEVTAKKRAKRLKKKKYKAKRQKNNKDEIKEEKNESSSVGSGSGSDSDTEVKDEKTPV